MTFYPIDYENWPRRAYFEHYFSAAPCTYSITANLDITLLLERVKTYHLRLYPVLIYGISKAVNERREFTMSVDEHGVLGWFDTVNPSYTVFHKDNESFSSIWTEYHADFHTFYNHCIEDMTTYGSVHFPDAKPACGNQFTISCIPWTTFTGFHLNIQNAYDYLPPIFTIGKYFSESEKMLLPIALQVHHAVCDGFHSTRLLNSLQKWADAFENK